MKLSQAIREGAAKTGPHKNGFGATGRDGKLKTCALGAAWIGLGNKGVHALYTSTAPKHPLDREFPMLDEALTRRQSKAICGCDKAAAVHSSYPDYKLHDSYMDQYVPLSNLIVHLNDDHEWTREAIADMVEDRFENDPIPAPPELQPEASPIVEKATKV